MGAQYIIHASITEYLIIFGTPLGTEGHSGIHTADDFFNILVGEQWVFEAGELEMTRYGPGDVNLMKRGVIRQYKMHKGCFALEYARGEFLHVTEAEARGAHCVVAGRRLDSADASIWLRRYVHVDSGLCQYLPDDCSYRSGDHQEPSHREDIDWAFFSGYVKS